MIEFIDRQTIINKFIEDSSYKADCKRIVKSELWSDLYQELCIAIIEMDEIKLAKAYCKGYMKFLAVRIMKNTVNRKGRRHNCLHKISNDDSFNLFNIIDDKEYSSANLYEILDKQLQEDEKENFYEAKLLRAYMMYGSYRKTSKATKIPFKSICATLNGYMNKLKPKLQEKLNEA